MKSIYSHNGKIQTSVKVQTYNLGLKDLTLILWVRIRWNSFLTLFDPQAYLLKFEAGAQ